jgi:membrane fusion protein (multidrug efflux system)
MRVIAMSSLVLLAACGKKPESKPTGAKVPVSVVKVEPARTELFDELPGRVDALENAEIRARVTGIVKAIHFQQGSYVKENQSLFTIDPAPFIAQRDQAAAQLKQAQADARRAALLAARYAKLIKTHAISRQDYDDAVSQAQETKAAVASAKANLETAEINLGYTNVQSPIDGRIGKALVTVGALVSGSQATKMAQVQQIDHVYIDVARSTAQLAELRKALAEGNITQSGDDTAKAIAILEDGSRYQYPGKLLFSGITVDPTTGQVNLRAEFPNPDHILLPGMYVRVKVQNGVSDKALLVPQQAVQHTADGLSTLMLVKDGKVAPTAVKLGEAVDGKWVVDKGLEPGAVVIVEGFQKIRPGAPVAPIPWKGKATDARSVAGEVKASAQKGKEPGKQESKEKESGKKPDSSRQGADQKAGS